MSSKSPITYDARSLEDMVDMGDGSEFPRFGFTHYVETPKNATMVPAFNVAKCERCGGLVQAPNSISVARGMAENVGLVKLDKLPADGWYNEQEDNDDPVEEICDACMGHEITGAPWQQEDEEDHMKIGQRVVLKSNENLRGTVKDVAGYAVLVDWNGATTHWESEDDLDLLIGEESVTVGDMLDTGFFGSRHEDAEAVRALANNMKHFQTGDLGVFGQAVLMTPETRDRIVAYLTELADLYESDRRPTDPQDKEEARITVALYTSREEVEDESVTRRVHNVPGSMLEEIVARFMADYANLSTVTGPRFRAFAEIELL